MDTEENGRGIWEWQVVKSVVAISVLYFVFIAITNGIGEEGVRHQIRWTARISFTLFCIAFSASSIHHFVKQSWSWWLLMNRKYIGISFAIIHLIHLAFLIWLQVAFHPVFQIAAKTSILGGGIAYMFVIIMLFTSFDYAKALISRRNWKIVHTIGGYWIWTIFLTTYLKRADTEPVHWIPVVILLTVVSLRVFKRFKLRKLGFVATISFLVFVNFTFESIAQSNIDTADLIIENGIIIDGTGVPGYRGDLIIVHGSIFKIITKKDDLIPARRFIDASGYVIAPGFIDLHAHGDPLVTPEFENFLAMGVTTIALGMDGSSVNASRFDPWLKEVENIHTGVNILPFIGHGTLRIESGIGQSRNPTTTQLASLDGLIDSALKHGSWGVSMGLEYQPGYYSNASELEMIAKRVGSYNGLITSHIRNEDDDQIEQSLTEMMSLADFCNVNISHLKVVYGKGEQRADEILQLLRSHSKSKHRITADFYPYTASYTGIGILFPEWTKNPKKYKEIREERGEELRLFLKNKVAQRNGPEATLFGTGAYKGKTLQDLVEEYNQPYEIILRDIIGPFGTSAAYFVMDEALQKRLMLDKNVVIGSDGSPTMHHPRGYGSFAKVIEEFVVKEEMLSLEAAIYKMSGKTAEILGLKDRGKIAEGMIADLIIFEPEVVKQKATFEQPHLLASGMWKVFLNGKEVYTDAGIVDRRGIVIRKQ